MRAAVLLRGSASCAGVGTTTMRNLRRSAAAILAAIVLGGSVMARAQSGGTSGESGEGTPQAPGKTVVGQPTGAKGSVERWFDLQAASFLARYRRVETAAGSVAANQLQDSVSLKARIKLDAAGRYSINGSVATGGAFTSGWNNTGWGTGDGSANLYVKQLFVAATPVAGVSFTAGGLSFDRGQSTEITSYDNDGYLVGERISVSRPRDLYLDEVSFTNAFLGDLAKPGVTSRFRRLDEPNYRQLLAAKQVRRWLTLSADYTRLEEVGTMRAAVSVKTPRARVVDLVQYEQYRRGGTDSAFGFGAFAEKSLAGRAVVRAGYADIDRRYGGLNADKFNAGRRWYAQSDFILTRDLTAWVFLTRAVGNTFGLLNATRMDVVLTFNAMGPIRRAGLFR